MANTRLRLWKGYNNGIINGTLYLLSSDGTVSVFDLTGGTLSMEIYNQDGTVAATISGTLAADPTTGGYSVIPGASALNALTSSQEYYYRIKVVQSPLYTAGLLFDTDENGRLLRCIVI